MRCLHRILEPTYRVSAIGGITVQPIVQQRVQDANAGASRVTVNAGNPENLTGEAGSTRRHSALRLCALVVGALCLASTAAMAADPPPGLSPAEREVFQRIKARIIRDATKALADDRMEGRGTLQPGGDKAAAWIADHMKSIGLAPGGEGGTYLQQIPLVATEFVEPTHVSVNGTPCFREPAAPLSCWNRAPRDWERYVNLLSGRRAETALNAYYRPDEEEDTWRRLSGRPIGRRSSVSIRSCSSRD